MRDKHKQVISRVGAFYVIIRWGYIYLICNKECHSRDCTIEATHSLVHLCFSVCMSKLVYKSQSCDFCSTGDFTRFAPDDYMPSIYTTENRSSVYFFRSGLFLLVVFGTSHVENNSVSSRLDIITLNWIRILFQ